MALVFIHGWLITLRSDMNRICVFLMMLVFPLLWSCKKGLDNDSFDSPARVYDIAVEGGFHTRANLLQYIRLTKPSTSPDSVPTPIRNASVVVNDSKIDLVYKEASPGIYVGEYRGDPNYNKAYTLTIVYNGKTYTAVDTLRQVVNIIDDFLPLSTKSQGEKAISGLIPKHTFGYLNSNKWFIYYQDIPPWNPAKFDQTRYYSYTHLLGSPNSLYPLSNLKRTFSLGNDDFITIVKISLSEKYAKYLYSVFMETDWNGLFSSVPVNVEGNISGNALGYFSANDVDLRRYRAKEL